MSGLSYRVDLEDIRFVLFEQLRVQDELVHIDKYSELDEDTYGATLEEAARIATEVLAPINGPGDRQGCRLDGEGNVSTPDGYREAWNTLAEGGWIGLAADPELGGAGMPVVMSMAVIEMFIGACMAFEMYPGLTAAAARVLAAHGPEGFGTAAAQQMYAGAWGGTMCLTESGAGSDVGENRCRATPQDAGAYHLEGEKIFISGGDQDLTENIVHLVLARTPDSPRGTKGLSLFAVPKFHVSMPDLARGERNGAVVTKIEEKMGIHGSATCVLTLGQDRPCLGWLVGEEHQGIAIMFEMMNEARIGVGAQGVAMASTATQYALAYARERLQGPSARQFRDPEADRVSITQHPDVRRMLMTMKVWTETTRSMLYRLGQRAELAEHDADPDTRERYLDRVDLLVPILKSHCTDVGFDTAVMGLQVLGGYGYIGEYPLEQLVRDAKICSIYEGTNGIQAIDLIGRKLRRKGGGLFMAWMADGSAECAGAREEGLTEAADAIDKALQQCGAAAMHLGTMGDQLEGVLLQASPFLTMMGVVHLGLEALNQARVAQRIIARDGETPHLKGKLLNLSFYVANLLPQAVALSKSVRASDMSCLDEVLFPASA